MALNPRPAGDFRHRVTIETPTESRTATGGQSFTWSTFVQRSGKLVPKNSREFMAAQAAFSEMGWLWEIKGRAAITTRMRLVFDGRYFNILGVQSPDGKSPARAEILQLICQEGPVRA